MNELVNVSMQLSLQNTIILKQQLLLKCVNLLYSKLHHQSQHIPVFKTTWSVLIAHYQLLIFLTMSCIAKGFNMFVLWHLSLIL